MVRRVGYSLIELLVVIAILGILASIGTYVYKSAAIRSRDSDRKTDIARISNALQQYYIDNKKYPNFDTGNGDGEEVGAPSRRYSAVWQLSNSTSCSHTAGIATRLTTGYLQEIPEDPLQKEDFASVSCNNTLISNQINRYYYLSGPSTVSAPATSATSFSLMAHLENPRDKDIITDQQQNPLKFPHARLGIYYTQVQNYCDGGEGSGVCSDVNYAIFGRVGR